MKTADQNQHWFEVISIRMVTEIRNVCFNNTRLDTVYIHMYIFLYMIMNIYTCIFM